MELVRLNKYLKDQGLCSRRKADDFIAKGFVTLNGVVVTELGVRVNPLTDKVEVLPELHAETSNFKYLLLNKPVGYVCSRNKEEGKSIFELLPDIEGLSYAGRLDKDSHGLVILSNDGKFTYKTFGAEFAKEKEYIVKVNKPIDSEYIRKQSDGCIRLDGKQIRRAKVVQIDDFTYSITLTEGINRQIRRMAEELGYRVLDLKRIRIEKITDEGLAVGLYRELTAAEVNYIMRK